MKIFVLTNHLTHDYMSLDIFCPDKYAAILFTDEGVMLKMT